MTDKQNYQNDFERSLEALEDIQLLSEFAVAPLVSNAYFYLTEMKRKADEISTREISNFSKVENVLAEKLSLILDDFFGNKSRYKDFKLYKNTKKIDLRKWNLVLEIIPEVLSLVSLFNFHGTVDVKFNSSNFVVSGLILENSSLTQSRKIIYMITRKLLRSKVLLTFNLEKTDRPGLFRLDLKADLSNDESLVYRVNFKANKNEHYVVGFSNIFSRYNCEIEDLKTIGSHNIIEIGNDLSVKHSVGLLELDDTLMATKDILHFPFIFRPLSIILPVKGSVVTTNFLNSQEDEDKRKHDVSKYFRTIDFFSLFNL